MHMSQKVLLMLSALGAACVPLSGRAEDAFPMEGWGSDFLAYLSTNFVNVAHVNVPEGMLQRLHNEDGSPLPMIGGEDLLFRLTHEDGSYEHIHVFTNTVGKAFHLQTGYVIKDATLLMVGGGGGGGGTHGGGGGAGGYLEKKGYRLHAGEYWVVVGTGGKAGPFAYDILGGNGGPGGDTTIASLSNSDFKMLQAYGGGFGGKGQGGCGGSSGGNGANDNPAPGYSDILEPIDPEQGCRGGRAYWWKDANGNLARCSSGGGGAGAPGGDGSSSNWNGGAAGGNGRMTMILGFEQYFAGGGAGGKGQSTEGGPSGGKGGGGSARQAWVTNLTGGPGENGLGGGGAGGGTASNGANLGGGRGGDGIVIFRYKGDPKPTGLILRVQ